MDSIISMYNATGVPFATSTIFVAFATFAATMKLIRSMTDDMLPSPARSFLESALHYLISPTGNRITIVVNELHHDMISRNQVYDAAEVYLRTKINPCTKRWKLGPCTKRLNVGKTPQQSGLNVRVEKGQEIVDHFEDMELRWSRFMYTEPQDRSIVSCGHEKNHRYFELSFHMKFKADRVLNEYLPFVLAKAKEAEGIKLYTRNCSFGNNEHREGGGGGWRSTKLDHPATFETLGMDPRLKDAVIEDLKGFLGGKELYKKVGKAWKRCYLLYGPPGTGKSSLIAAMANYLRFDVYDLGLTSLSSNSELRSSLMSTTNRSIVVIRDVDCRVGMQQADHRLPGTHEQPYEPHNKVSLSCLLSFMDGLCLSCGDERIIVFTTNYSYKLDPALLCPGRMDMHIRMSYCSSQVFKLLASNYLGIHDRHTLFSEIEDRLENEYVAVDEVAEERHTLFSEIEDRLENEYVAVDEVAEELRKSANADIALRGVVKLLKRKRMEAHEIEQDRNQWTSGSVQTVG